MARYSCAWPLCESAVPVLLTELIHHLGSHTDAIVMAVQHDRELHLVREGLLL